MFYKDIGIDLGTANILINVKGEGIVLNEPSVVAIDEETKKILAIGIEAHKMLGRTPGNIRAVKPMKDGVIADFELTEAMLNYFIKKVKAKSIFIKPRILICCPTNVTAIEKNAIKEAAERTGAKKVFIEEEPKVAALGVGLNISEPNGSMIIDIGGGTTDIAVLSLGDIVTSASIKIAGNTFDKAIIEYIKTHYKLIIGERTAEDIKIQIGTLYESNKKGKIKVKGRGINGLPEIITVTSEEIEEALKPCMYEIIKTVKQVLEKTPPELSADIINNGIVLTGGGSMIEGLDILLEKEIKVPIYVAENPLTSVAEGTGKMLEKLNLVQDY
ncbi:MAG: rod shape-determining protein [Bacilli bacterium]|nr:rod shape-determining protein [Bacilli bacterium]